MIRSHLLKFIVYLCVLPAILLAGIYLLAYPGLVGDIMHPSEPYYTQTADYELVIYPQYTIYNVTIYVPIPTLEGTPSIGLELLTVDIFQKKENMINTEKAPSPAINLSLVQVDGQIFLKITSSKMGWMDNYHFRMQKSVRHNGTQVQGPVNGFYDKVPSFFPKYGVLHISCSPEGEAKSQNLSTNLQITRYDTRIYADYDGGKDVAIESRYHYTSGDDSYTDEYAILLSGKNHGWVAVDGEIFPRACYYRGIYSLTPDFRTSYLLS